LNDPVNFPTRAGRATPPEPSGQNGHPRAGPAYIRSLFTGVDGLRSGWSLLIFIALMAALIGGMSVLRGLAHIAPMQPGDGAEISPDFLLLNDFPLLIATAFVTVVMSRIERRRVSAYGIGARRALPDVFAGWLWGVACLSLLVLFLWRCGYLVFGSRLLSGAEIFRYGTIWLASFGLVGVCEEYLARGYLLFTLARGFAGLYAWLGQSRHSRTAGFWSAALLLSTLFGLGHHSNPGESPVGLFSAALFSLLFCLAIWRTGSLWWAIGFHASWDWAQSFLYGVGDSGYRVQHHLLAALPVGPPLLSGGSAGTEGSIFMLGAFALATGIVLVTLPRTRSGVSDG